MIPLHLVKIYTLENDAEYKYVAVLFSDGNREIKFGPIGYRNFIDHHSRRRRDYFVQCVSRYDYSIESPIFWTCLLLNNCNTIEESAQKMEKTFPELKIILRLNGD